MSMSTTTSKIPQVTLNGVATAIPVSFPFASASDLVVLITDLAGVVTTLTLGVGYTVAGAGSATGGTVTLASAYSAGYKADVMRVVSLAQGTKLRGQTAWSPEVVEAAFDHAAVVDQQLQEQVSRSVKLSAASSGVDPTLPTPLPGAAIGWNAGGSGLGNIIGPSGGTIQDAKAITLSALSSILAGQGDALIGVLPPFVGAVPRTQHSKNSDILNARDFGVLGAGMSTPLSGVTSFGGNNTTGWTLAQWQAVMPCVNALTNQLDWATLQTAINAAINAGKRLVVPAGTYITDQPLMAFVFNAGTWSYFTLHVEGEKSTWDFSLAATIIKPTYNNAPALIIQQGRGVKLEGLAFVGTNDIYTLVGVSGANYYKVMNASNLNTNGSRDAQYSPYCAVAVDPFSSAGAAAGYPTLSSYYTGTTAGSSDTQFDDCRFENFIVGVALTPNASNQNNDQVTFKNCMLGYNKVNLAIGQSQSRGVGIYNSQLYFASVGIDCKNYGLGQGGGVKVYGGIGMGLKYLLSCNVERQDTVLVSGLYCESISSIGFATGTASTQTGVLFQACAFNFTDFGTGLLADYQFYTSAPVLFESCLFTTMNQTYPGPMRFQTSGGMNSITFRSCFFKEASVGELTLAPSQGVNGLDWCNVYFDGCGMSEIGKGSGLWSNLSHNVVNFAASYEDRIPSPFGQMITYAAGTAGQFLRNGSVQSENQWSLGSLAVTLGSNGQATFTASNGNLVRVGDLIYVDTGAATFDGPTGSGATTPGHLCLGVASSVASNMVTVNGVPQSFVAGTYALYAEWMSRVHQASTCTTNSTTTLASVTNPATWKNGQHIKGAGIVQGTYIVSGGGTATLLLSQPTAASASGVRIYDANLHFYSGTAV